MVVEELTSGGQSVRCVWFDREDRAWSWTFLTSLLILVHPPSVPFVAGPGGPVPPPTGPSFLS